MDLAAGYVGSRPGSAHGHGSRPGSAYGSAVSRMDPDEDHDEHFKVVIRVRPPLERELQSVAWKNVVAVSDEQTQVCLQETVPEANPLDRASGTTQVFQNHFFKFDHVYDQNSSQPEVYSGTARAAVLSTLQGYNATILAYGPTGTGKTYTMQGARGADADGRGIIPRSMEEIFEHIRHCRDSQSRFLVRASYLQIYNEVLSDLLKADRHQLSIREDRKRGVFVEGLSEWLCRSPGEVQELMERGSAGRATAQTAVNDVSSRSHAVFFVIVEQSEEDGDWAASTASNSPEEPGDFAGSRRCVRIGRLNLVDLAGSERPRVTGATGVRLEETKKINQSLSALGNVIAALTERRPLSHIPYRDSKLTRLLEDSLGGNCRTTMMAMVSPAAEGFPESLSTLKFAHRAKSITNSPQVNEDVDQRTLLRRYETELQCLRAELRARNRNVVDKRQLQELEAERQRAEEDRMVAVSALEERSAVLVQEKAQKKQLEERIRQMSSQLVVGGQRVENTPQFRDAVAQQERIRSEYAARLSELEKERSTIEEDKAQVSRYKQLLLKQRDIMIALTQRLSERDETIIALQEEMDAHERRCAELEDQLDEKSVHLLAAERRNAMLIENSGAVQQPRYTREDAVLDPRGERPMQMLSADDKVAELTALADARCQENHRLRLELEQLQTALHRAEAGALTNLGACERASLPRLLDRISEGILEVTAPINTKLQLTQDVGLLKRLVAGASVTDVCDTAGCTGGSPGAAPTSSVKAAATAVATALSETSSASSLTAALQPHTSTALASHSSAGMLPRRAGAVGRASPLHASPVAGACSVLAAQGISSGMPPPLASRPSSADRHSVRGNAATHGKSPSTASHRDGSAIPTPVPTPDGSCASGTPRPIRNRRSLSLERSLTGESLTQSCRGDMPVSLRRSSAASSGGGGSCGRSASLGSMASASSLKVTASRISNCVPSAGSSSAALGSAGAPSQVIGAAQSGQLGQPSLLNSSGLRRTASQNSASQPTRSPLPGSTLRTGAPSAEELREEAQRSVDALLARRKAEMRSKSGSPKGQSRDVQ
eukprot:gnl/TRDRNA2_/TRDRNA2_167168_c0_seq1.p1 gnl/TRDRNA2_/TRDRNA2_167168_c0~~gnl/TRDRNA2_/TRDRNA2_167168_c0_seq1.p1  ORF type:complete len:1064 (+),score=172.38 gnl/TRDRNA2_/TRDRNA2_167168_c0_seq1:94-3285(+)